VFGESTKGKLGIKEENEINNEIKHDLGSADFLRRIDENSYSCLNVNTVVKFPLGNAKIKMVSCGSTYTLALDITGLVFAWGEGGTGALGTGSYHDEISPVRISFGNSAKMKFINAGFFHSAAISDKGSLFTWGIGSEGQLGHKSNLNTNSPKKMDFFQEGEAAFVSCGMIHTACIDEKGFLFTWGGNKNGQLGHGDYEDRNFPMMVKFFKNFCVCYVNCGSNTTFVITEEGKAFSFGSNLNGKLAAVGILENEILQSNTFPNPLDCQISIQKIGELGDGLDGCRIYQICTSNQFCLALTNRGMILTWGNNNNGGLGRGDQVKTFKEII